ncbi:hypothetical protein DFJ73DRAFT_837437 [Zopfochytrium polystomum]|nr:hypothetical protein DFJ73DRAFT_837437 [Zopfochytrium polystomum]
MCVQYWRSSEHLERYAAASGSAHHGPWKWLMKLGRESPELGFWHETFVVRDGDYESISVNCPPFHLCNARTAEVVPAHRNMATMKGRLETPSPSGPKGSTRRQSTEEIQGRKWSWFWAFGVGFVVAASVFW